MLPISFSAGTALESTGRKKATDHVPAVKKLKKSEMLGKGQVYIHPFEHVPQSN